MLFSCSLSFSFLGDVFPSGAYNQNISRQIADGFGVQTAVLCCLGVLDPKYLVSSVSALYIFASRRLKVFPHPIMLSVPCVVAITHLSVSKIF